MRQRSDIWVKLAQGDFVFQAKAWVGDKVYTEISAPKIDRSLMSSPLSVGNCISSTLRISILTDDVLDAKVPIIIKGRLTDGKTVSEWLPFGTFFINQRSSYDGLWTLSCYDAMLKANQSYLSADDDGTGWPKSMPDVVAEIAYRIGVSVDPRTIINFGPDYNVPCPTGLTMAQVLGYIGGCHGGNWIITEENALRLVPLMYVPPAPPEPPEDNTGPIVITKQPETVVVEMGETARISVEATGDGLTYAWYRKFPKWPQYGFLLAEGVTGNYYSTTMADGVEGTQIYCLITDKNGNSVKTRTVYLHTPYSETGAITPDSTIENTYYITDDAGLPIVTPEGYYLVWAEDGYVSAVDGLVTVKAILGKLDIGTAVTITGVSMTGESQSYFTAGDVTGTGVIKVDGNPYATQGICDALHEKFSGLTYLPYTASKVIYDPATELGDQVKIGDLVSSVIYASNLNLDIGFTADINAPNSEELSAEYPYLTEFKKLVQTTTALNASIKQTAEDLKETVENNNTDVTALSESLADEINRASGVERELNTRIGDEETRAKAAEKILQDNITAEETRAKAAEDELRQSISYLNGTEFSAQITALHEQDETLLAAISTLTVRYKAADADLLDAINAANQTHSTDINNLLTVINGQADLIQGLSDRLAQDESTIANLTARLAALEGNNS